MKFSEAIGLYIGGLFLSVMIIIAALGCGALAVGVILLVCHILGTIGTWLYELHLFTNVIFYSGCAIPGVFFACKFLGTAEDFLPKAMGVTLYGACIGWYIYNIVSTISKAGAFVPNIIFYIVYIVICVAILCFMFLRKHWYHRNFVTEWPSTGLK